MGGGGGGAKKKKKTINPLFAGLAEPLDESSALRGPGAVPWPFKPSLQCSGPATIRYDIHTSK